YCQPLGSNHHFTQVTENSVCGCVHTPAKQSSELSGDHLEIEPGLDRSDVALDRDAVNSKNNCRYGAFNSLCQPSQGIAEPQGKPPWQSVFVLAVRFFKEEPDGTGSRRRRARIA